ncbi:MAG: EamA family transporter [Alphaproteobacteria bacterium]|nr:EamA family transporter [Alphaproteobacteria bacterium]
MLAFGVTLPLPSPGSLLGSAGVAGGQIVGTFFLLQALQSRNFAVGVAYSKTDVLQAALFEALVLGSAVTLGAGIAMLVATAGVMLISLKATQAGVRGLVGGLAHISAVYGLLSGAGFAIAIVSVRSAVLALAGSGPFAASIVALLSTLAMQVVGMGLFLLWREPGAFAVMARHWRVPVFVGLMGALGSICWFLAMSVQEVAYVRTLGLVEIVATIVISRVLFKEKTVLREVLGIVLLLAGIALLLNSA